jgi:hypothetical protein
MPISQILTKESQCIRHRKEEPHPWLKQFKPVLSPFSSPLALGAWQDSKQVWREELTHMWQTLVCLFSCLKSRNQNFKEATKSTLLQISASDFEGHVSRQMKDWAVITWTKLADYRSDKCAEETTPSSSPTGEVCVCVCVCVCVWRGSDRCLHKTQISNCNISGHFSRQCSCPSVTVLPHFW